MYNANCTGAFNWVTTEFPIDSDTKQESAAYVCVAGADCPEKHIRAKIPGTSTICVDFRYKTYAHDADPKWDAPLAVSSAMYWKEVGSTGTYNLVDANAPSGSISTCHNNYLHIDSVNAKYDDPRFRTDYYVSNTMTCVAETECDFLSANMVLQPNGTLTTISNFDYYTYFICQQNCNANYFVLVNGTCAKKEYCPVN